MSNNIIVPHCICQDCGVEKPHTLEFYPSHIVRGIRYLRYVCRICWNVRRRARMATDKGKAQRRQYRANRPEKAREEKRRSQKRNRVSANERNKRYAARYPDKIRANCLNYQSRKRGAEGKHTVEDIAAQLETQDGMCFYCGIRLYEEYEVDHYIPLTKGGSNNPDNLVCACPSCNSSKNNHLYSEWESSRGW